MAQVFHNLEKTAELLGLSSADVNRLRERNELRGFRDGSDWKFKAEDVETFAQKLKADQESSSGDEASDSDGDVLLSEHELGQSDPGASGTVIGGPNDKVAAADSDVKLAESDIKLTGSDIKLGGSEIDPAGVGQDVGTLDSGSGLSDFEELDLTLDEDLTLEDSQLVSQATEAKADDGSAVDLSAAGEGLADDDLVLGGSGSGSDITIGGDSGISLVDPADSGLSLEAPLELGGGEESLELGEDDMITLSEQADTESPTELKTDGDFLLTPMDDGSGDEDSESGSQVIALDPESSDEAATMIGSMPAAAPMLDEDLGADAGMGMDMAGGMSLDVAEGAPLGAPQNMAGGPMLMDASAALPEAPYSVWNILALALCAIFLVLSGMMMYDLVRNMWSWDTPYPVNSSLMDAILNMFEG